jgi:hypothetical protein
MEMQGRVDEGVRFLEERMPSWAAEDNGFAFHNWWHLALFHIDRGDFVPALAIYDRILASAHAMALSRLDATSLLWRLKLEGVDIGDRYDAVADAWSEAVEGEGGFYAFNDFHAAMAFAATGREASMSRLRAALEKAAWEESPNGEMTRVIGIDACEGMAAFGDGNYARAVDKIMAVRDIASRFGGSHAQRDVFTLTLIEAARRNGQAALAAHITNERLTHKPASPWGRRISERIRTGSPASGSTAAARAARAA